MTAEGGTLLSAGTSAAETSTELEARLAGGRLHLRTTAHHSRWQGLGTVVLGRIFQPERVALRLGLPAEAAANPATLLLHAFRQDGDAAMDRLYGEFCFLLWDTDRGRLLLGRDSGGSYPLFYALPNSALPNSALPNSALPNSALPNSGLCFSSDLSLLAATFGMRLRANERHIARWLALVPAETGSTFFNGIFAVPPGCVMAHEGGTLRTVRTWDPTAVPIQTTNDPRWYAHQLRDVLNEAVSDRLEIGGSAATTLSGGLDSSSLTALAARLLQTGGRRLHAFTAVPGPSPADLPGHFCNEWSRAASVASLYPNIDHVPIPQGRHSTFGLMDRFSAAEMQPTFNPANYDWLYETCLCAAGRGAQTLHMGLAGNLTVSYDGHGALSAMAAQGQLVSAAWLGVRLHLHGGLRVRAVAHQLLRPWLPASVRSWIDGGRRGANRVEQYSLIRLPFALEHGPGPTPRDDRASTARERRAANLRRIDPGPTLHAMRRLAGVHITDATNDRRVVEFCFSVPEELFCQGGVPRSLIRQAMRGLLPETVRTERLRGLQSADFGLRFQAELPQALAELELLRDVPLADRCLDLQAMARMLAEARRHTGSNSQIHFWPKLLRALSLGRFLRSLEQGTPGADAG